MRGLLLLVCPALLIAMPAPSQAQLAVQANPNHEQLLASRDAHLAANTRLVYDFWRTVFEGGHMEFADKYMAESYIQHNPNVPTGLKGFMDTFRERFAQKLPADYKRELLNVVGENDMVVIYVRQTWTGRDGKHNQALGFDMFRVQDGKIAEHWDAD